jgi:stress response protein YsnF
MTTIRQLLQTGPAKANELFAKLVDTSDGAVKTRERLFADLRAELDLLAQLEEEHLFPVLRKHKATKGLVSAALEDNKQVSALLTELENTPKDSEEFATKVTELRKVHQQSVRDDKNELLPAILKALSDEEAQAIVDRIEAEKAEIEEARRAEAEQRRAEARHEREQEENARAEQVEAAEREQRTRVAMRESVDTVARTGEVAAASTKQIVQSTAAGVQRLAAAPLSTGSILWDTMFDLWTAPLSRSVARAAQEQPSSHTEEVIPLAEETLVVGKETVTSGTTTVRRFVVETPVEQQVSLYDEKVIVERRKPVTDAVTGETLTEVTIEMIETTEVPVVGKSVKVREEVVVRRERTSRVETVRDTVRRDKIEVTRSDQKRRALASSRK